MHPRALKALGRPRELVDAASSPGELAGTVSAMSPALAGAVAVLSALCALLARGEPRVALAAPALVLVPPLLSALPAWATAWAAGEAPSATRVAAGLLVAATRAALVAAGVAPALAVFLVVGGVRYADDTLLAAALFVSAPFGAAAIAWAVAPGQVGARLAAWWVAAIAWAGAVPALSGSLLRASTGPVDGPAVVTVAWVACAGATGAAFVRRGRPLALAVLGGVAWPLFAPLLLLPRPSPGRAELALDRLEASLRRAGEPVPDDVAALRPALLAVERHAGDPHVRDHTSAVVDESLAEVARVRVAVEVARLDGERPPSTRGLRAILPSDG